MEDIRAINEAADIVSNDALPEKPLKTTVLVGLLMLACSIFTPDSWRIGSFHLVEAFIAGGFLAIIVPLLFVSRHQAKTRRHFGWFLHLICPGVGLLMVLSRVVLQPLGVGTIFLNLWSIGATFLIFPLFQQLIELLSGSVDLQTGGRQVRYQD